MSRRRLVRVRKSDGPGGRHGEHDVVWAPSYFVIGNVDTWQLIINTLTTIVTFLMVVLLQNSQTRADEAENRESS